MSKKFKIIYAVTLAVLCIASSLIAASPDKFIGRWALTIPGGGAGWLGIEDKGTWFDASILWGGGSVVPVDSVYFDDGKLYVTRVRKVRRKNADGKVIRIQNFTETISATVSGDKMELTRSMPQTNGKGVREDTFTGERIPPLPPKPDLSKAKRGETVKLFNGKNLDGWKLLNKNSLNGWSVKDGVLVNNPVREKGQHGRFGNLRTVDEFEDFNIRLQVKGQKGFNSGVYLRGVYEVQVADSYGKPLDSHHM